MEYIIDRNLEMPFSLHDCKIMNIEVKGDSVVFTMDKIYQYNNGEEKVYMGTIEFTKADADSCSVLVFNSPYGNEGVKEFTGVELKLTEFIERYPDAEFEVITEGYKGYDTIYQGYIWPKDSDQLIGMINLWNTGEMKYQIG